MLTDAISHTFLVVETGWGLSVCLSVCMRVCVRLALSVKNDTKLKNSETAA